MKWFKRVALTVAVVLPSLPILLQGAATVTASKDYVDRKTKVESATNLTYGVVGYTIGMNSNSVFASTNYVDRKVGESEPGDYYNVSNAAMSAYSDLVEFASTGTVERARGYGTQTRWTDATGCVWEVANYWTLHHSDHEICLTSYISKEESLWCFGYPEETVAGRTGTIRYYLEIYDGVAELSAGEYYSDFIDDYYIYPDGNSIDVTVDYDGGNYIDFSGQLDNTYAVWGRTNLIGRVALTNDILPSVAVVAPSTNAVVGSAADAKATGMALYTGFTEWEFSGDNPYEYDYKNMRIEIISDEGSFTYVLYDSDEMVSAVTRQTSDEISVSYDTISITATRHLVTPTKTSQLTNDGSNGIPFAVVSQIPSLAGQTFDFSRNYEIIRATAAIAEALGATVTNNPTANQGGN